MVVPSKMGIQKRYWARTCWSFERLIDHFPKMFVYSVFYLSNVPLSFTHFGSQWPVATHLHVPHIVTPMYVCLLSLGDLVIVDGVKTFDMTIMENKLMSFTNDASWNLAQDEVIKRCKHEALTSLTPQQRAVYTYMCNSFSLFAHCDRLQADRGALDESGSRRRENFVHHMTVNGIISGSSVAWTAWTECAQSAGLTGTPVTGWAQRYAAILSASACLLRKLFDDGGRLDTGRLFEQAAAKLASARLEELVNHCGPSVEGYLTAEEFLQCCVKAGPFIMAVSSSNFVASGMPESCTILL